MWTKNEWDVLNVYIYAHVDTLYTCYLFYYVFLSYYLFVEFGQCIVHIRSQAAFFRYLPRCKRHHQWGSRNRRGLPKSWSFTGIWTSQQPLWALFSFKKRIFPKSKTKSVFCREPTTVFSFGQLSFSPLFLFIDVVCIYIHVNMYIIYISKIYRYTL